MSAAPKHAPSRPKRDLVRLVRTAEGQVSIDLTGKLNGRGAYLCHDAECWTLAERRRAVERALSARLDTTAWQNLLASRPTKEVPDPAS
jgi:predicted RNA-binding protein YlxR (DUF448 family)